MITLPFETPDEQSAALARVMKHLAAGGLIACPTETVYGFGCVLRDDALDRLANVKRRAPGKSFLLLVADVDTVAGIEWTESASALAAAFWPGPLTLALRCPPGALPDRVVAPGGTVAIRATSHPGLRALLMAFGEPITSTSANAPGGSPARTADAVTAVLAPLALDDEFIVLDGGELRPSLPSTIVDCSVDPPVLIRPGAIDRADIAEIVHGIEMESGRRAG
jgi:L-threonylcarbamoyladenylate synthase